MRRLLLSLCALALLVVPAAHGTSAGLVVSQIYAGGGNSGATYANDFVELLNTGSTAIDLSSWTVQYASASSSSWSATPLSGTVQPGRYYLVALASSGTVGAALPASDASGSTNLAVAGGKVAIVHDTAALSCSSCSSVSSVSDLVGYGSATDFEGAAAPNGSATLAVARAGAGCTDTDHNDADFATAAPAPRNSASPAATCGAGSDASQDGAVDLDVAPVLSLSLQRSALSFGSAAAGETPASLGDQVTVVSNNATGYALSVHRTVFSPVDLPLALAATAPAGGTLGAGVSGAALTRIPVAPAADLLVGTTAARSASSGDVWPASIGFATALPVVPPGHYTARVTFTVIGR
jgi:hypothetical protein